MSITIENGGRAALEPIRELIADPSLTHEFEPLREPGHLEQKLGDPLRAHEATLFARVDGERAGFTIAFVVPRAEGGVWASVRIGVIERFRRHGAGRALFEAARRAIELRADGGTLHEIVISAWRANEAAEAFAARLGLRHVRCFWRMARPPDPRPPVRWPAGVTMRLFDGGEQALADWNDAYNASFARHYHFVPGTIEMGRHMAADPLFLRDGLALAYRDGRCVGFCRNELAGGAGVVEALGVAPEARGIGLGRALLRWAVGDIAARGCGRVELMVDGENDSALALYRSEGFGVARTRDLWALVPDPRRGPR
jgi:mycothiol synthase